MNNFKTVIVIRHGELENPKRIAYNRDTVMEKEDIIHLSGYGKEQYKLLGQLIKKQFKIVKILYSPETRAKESVEALNEVLELNKYSVKEDAGLDEIYAPAGYKERLSLDEWNKVSGNAYDKVKWAKYNHEMPLSIINRFEITFNKLVNELKPEETGILISHGDPIAWWIYYKVNNLIPEYTRLKDFIYLKKGEALVIKVGSNNKWAGYYILADKSLKEGTD